MPRHRWCRVHRLAPRGFADRPWRPGHRGRRPLAREAGEPRAGHRTGRRVTRRGRPRRGARGRALRHEPARGRVSPGGAGRRALLGRAPTRRRIGKRAGDYRRAGGGPRGRHPARGQQLDWRGPLRGGRCAADARGVPDQAACPLRSGQVRGRGLLRCIRPLARAIDRVAALRQRVWPAPGRPRRGGGSGDLLRLPDRGAPPQGLWRRAPDP